MRATVLAALAAFLVGGLACKGGSSGGPNEQRGPSAREQSASGSGQQGGGQQGGGQQGGGQQGGGQQGGGQQGGGQQGISDADLKDAMLVARVGAKIGVVRMLPLRLEAQKGKVTLKGAVSSAKDKADIEAAVKATEGVKEVVSALTVSP